jgi:hypothetical protein
MHPLVRDLYKRVILVGRDYPLGLDYVRRTWKRALRDPKNCPSCFGDACHGNHQNNASHNHHRAQDGAVSSSSPSELCLYSPECERELRKAVGKGRYMVREMIALIQLKKYRIMNQRYSLDSKGSNTDTLKAFLSQPQPHDNLGSNVPTPRNTTNNG